MLVSLSNALRAGPAEPAKIAPPSNEGHIATQISLTQDDELLEVDLYDLAFE